MKVLYVAKLVILCLSLICIALLVSAQSQSSAGELEPVDTYFVTQTSLGTPFQVDSGNLAVTKGYDPSHSRLCATHGEFPHRRKQRTGCDS
jgi:hypothetical protein